MRRTISAISLASVLACAGGGGPSIDITKPVTGDAATNAEKAYKRGLEEKKSSNYMEATRFLEWVRNNFPYSQYAALSELALADMAFERDDFATAATSYQEFVKSHPSHPKADFAAFRVGVAHYRDRPNDWFLLPPSYEKDQAPIRSALDALQRFVLSYPKSELVPEARRLIADCRERLVEHERYVATFYWGRGAWRGAAGRFLSIADSYGDLEGGKLRGDSLWRASQAYRNLNDVPAQRKTLTRLVQEAPYDPHRREAEAILRSLPADAPSPAPEPAKPGEAKPAPITPAETPASPHERPQADPGPGQPPGDADLPQRPEGAPKPARPTTREPPPAPPPKQPPVSQPEPPPLAPPSR